MMIQHVEHIQNHSKAYIGHSSTC